MKLISLEEMGAGLSRAEFLNWLNVWIPWNFIKKMSCCGTSLKKCPHHREPKPFDSFSILQDSQHDGWPLWLF